MNVIQVAGHLGGDPEIRYTVDRKGQQLKVTTFRVATNMRKSGKEETYWWRVTVWGDRFENMMPYLKKGSAVFVIGELRPSIYSDREGCPQISLDIRADILRFSPFGKPMGEQQSVQGQMASPSYNAPATPAASKSFNQSFGEQTFGMSSEGGGTHGESTFHDAMVEEEEEEEEPIPF